MKNHLFNKPLTAFVIMTLGLQFGMYAQNGPGGIGTTDGTSHLKLWLRADKGVYTDAGTTPATNGQAVQQWNDQSGNGLHATQATLNGRPLFTTTGFNGFPALNFSGISQWMTAGLNINPSVNPNITIIAVSSTPNFGSATPFSKLWGHDNGGYDRSIGFDPRASSGIFGYFNGAGVGDFPFLVGTPAANEPFSSVAMYTPTHFLGYLQGVIGANDTASNGDGEAVFSIGAVNSAGIEAWSGNIVELIAYDTILSEAQKINVENYLSSKYSTSIVGNDIYRMDNAGAGNFDYDVVGLHHYFTDPVLITTARGTGIITLSNASNLFPGGSYFIGHNNASLSPVTTDLPAGIASRLGRIWAGTENDGDIGTLDLSFDLPELSATDPASLRLLIDRSGDGNFADETVASEGVVSGFTRSGNTYTINVNMGDAQRFTIGSVSTLTLPVNLRSILVDKVGQTNKVEWKTERETGFDHFEVQRSEDGTHFYSIGNVQASGSTSAVKDYSFTDNAPLAVNYYRLKMIDQKGQFTYSQVVKMIQTNKRFTISPNPATNLVSVTGLDGSGTTIQLMDVNGKLLEQVKTTGLQHTFYLTKYPKGVYHIKVSSAKDQFTETIIKQ
ncbi:MAG: T9SS type A sorting domain-containing protein [Williamsia sp.]|nr:T9SS type A sorting domain-containing protein [Williamsia sp.]